MDDSPGIEVSDSGRVTKCGAIFDVPLAVIVAGLKAINALPADAEVEPLAGSSELLTFKARSCRLPVVREGDPYPRRRAVAGRATGEVI